MTAPRHPSPAKRPTPNNIDVGGKVMKHLAFAALAVLLVAGVAYADAACMDTCTWTQAIDYWIDAQTGVKICRANVEPPAESFAMVGGGCCCMATGAFLIEREVCKMAMCNGVPAVKQVVKSKFLGVPAESGDMVSIASGCHYWQLVPVERCIKWDPVAGCSLCAWLWDDC
jgi:hypothetical protein